MQLGYEIFDWLMVFADGELAFTDTSESQDESHASAFPIFGFGGGLRATIHVTRAVRLLRAGQGGALRRLRAARHAARTSATATPRG